MKLSSMSWRLLIGLVVGMAATVICAGLMISLLVFLRRCKEKPKTAMFSPESLYAGGNMDMSRTMAWSPRHGSSPADRGAYEPTLRPLHAQNDPFFHRNQPDARGSPWGTNSSGRSGGRIAVTPFRESHLPASDTSYSDEGRPVRGYEKTSPSGRAHQPRNEPTDTSLNTHDNSDQNARPNVGGALWWRSNSPSNERRNGSPPENSNNANTRGQIDFYSEWSNSERDSTDLRDVYY